MKKNIIISTLLLGSIIANNCLAQKTKDLNDLMGNWQVVKWIPLIRSGAISPNEASYNKKENSKCSKGIVIINNSGIHIKPSGICDFDEFEGEIKLDSIINLKVVPENSNSK